ncbi:MAG: hypothetical protein PHE24_01625 [Patescibacteria group bacterium]|nr:hypothetical protein [Patescibacteria group bacterium]
MRTFFTSIIMVFALLGVMSSPAFAGDKNDLLTEEISGIMNGRQPKDPNYVLKWSFIEFSSFPVCVEKPKYQKFAEKLQATNKIIGAMGDFNSSEDGFSAQVCVVTYLERISDGAELPNKHFWKIRYTYDERIAAWQYDAIESCVTRSKNKENKLYLYKCESTWGMKSLDIAIRAGVAGDLAREPGLKRALIGGADEMF